MKFMFDKKYYLLVNEQPLAGTTFVNWMKVLLENTLDIDWQFIPKALYVTVMVVLITPLRLIEKMRFDKRFQHMRVEKPIFIIGHWRSGTTFLHYLMGQDTNLGYTSTMDTLDPSIFLGYEDLLQSIVTKSLPQKRPMDDLEMGVNLPYEEEYAIANLSPYSFYHSWYFPRAMDRYFQRYVLFDNVDATVVDQWKKTYLYFLQKITYKFNGKQIMLKSLVNTARIKHLLDLFPDAKFVHLMRNPYEVYMSTWMLYRGILPLFSFQHIDEDALDQSILRVYKGLYTRYLLEKHLIPQENLIELRYEDFIREPLQTLKAIYTKLGIPGFEEVKPAFQRFIDRHANYRKNGYAINDAVKTKVYKNWEFAFKAFGYPK